MVKKQSSADRVDTLEQVLIDIWHHAQECDGSRGEQQNALDAIQALIEEEMADVAEYEPTFQEEAESEDEDSDSSDEDD